MCSLPRGVFPQSDQSCAHHGGLLCGAPLDAQRDVPLDDLRDALCCVHHGVPRDAQLGAFLFNLHDFPACPHS